MTAETINTPEHTFRVLSRSPFLQVAEILKSQGFEGMSWDNPKLRAELTAHKWTVKEFRAANNEYLNNKWGYW